MATNKIQTGLRLNEATYEKLRLLSAKESRSLNNLIEYVLQNYLDDYEDSHGPIEVMESEAKH